MGYTHYFSNSRCPYLAWSVFLTEVRQIFAHPAAASVVCLEYDQPDQPPLVTDRLVQFNGKGELGHETFRLECAAHREFCKTGGPAQMSFECSWGKDYDVVVCAVLLSAHRHLGELVTSDGDWTEPGWMRARALYARVTGHLCASPWPTKTCVQCGRSYAKTGHAWGGHTICATKNCKGSSWSNGACMTCGSEKLKYPKPRTWCYFCASGFGSREEAGAATRDLWNKILQSLSHPVLPGD